MNEEEAPDNNRGRQGTARRLSRRQFGQRAAFGLAAAGAAALPALSACGQRHAAATSGLSPAEESEAETRYRNTLAAHGNRIPDVRRPLLRSTIDDHVRMLEAVRSYSLANGDAPATVLRLVRNTNAQTEASTVAPHGKS